MNGTSRLSPIAHPVSTLKTQREFANSLSMDIDMISQKNLLDDYRYFTSMTRHLSHDFLVFSRTPHDLSLRIKWSWWCIRHIGVAKQVDVVQEFSRKSVPCLLFGTCLLFEMVLVSRAIGSGIEWWSNMITNMHSSRKNISKSLIGLWICLWEERHPQQSQLSNIRENELYDFTS